MRWRLPLEFWLLIAMMLLTSAFTPAFAKIEPYFASYALRSAWWGGVIIMLMSAGIFFGQPLWLWLCGRVHRARVMISAAVLELVALGVFWLAGADSPIAAAAAALAFGLGNGGVGMVQWAAFSSAVARHAPNHAGLCYGLFAANAKIGLALGGTLIAAALNVIDFRGSQNGTLAALMAGIPAVGAALLMLVGFGLRASENEQRST